MPDRACRENWKTWKNTSFFQKSTKGQKRRTNIHVAYVCHHCSLKIQHTLQHEHWVRTKHNFQRTRLVQCPRLQNGHSFSKHTHSKFTSYPKYLSFSKQNWFQDVRENAMQAYIKYKANYDRKKRFLNEEVGIRLLVSATSWSLRQ